MTAESAMGGSLGSWQELVSPGLWEARADWVGEWEGGGGDGEDRQTMSS